MYIKYGDKKGIPHARGGVSDSRTRPLHRANDGIIRKVDDPIWKRIWFGRNVYRCRCRLVSLTEDQAIARSKGQTGIHKVATEDPHRDVAWDNVDVLGGDVLAFGLERAVANRIESGKVNPTLQQAFIKTNSVIEAQKQALDLGIKAVNYAGRLDIAKEVNIVLSEFKQRGFPLPDNVLINENAFIRWAEHKKENPENLIAAFTTDSKQIETYLVLNPLYPHWNDLSIDAKHNFDTRYWSTDNRNHILHHEFGHFMHYVQDKLLYKTLIGATFTENDLLIAKKVSNYATDNHAEFVAEVFAKLLSGASVDDDVMQLYTKLKGYKP